MGPDPDFQYTAGEAIYDGFLYRLDAETLITANARQALSSEAIESIVRSYREHIYADPPEADPYNEASASYAYYIREGQKVWVQRSLDGITILLSEDH
jgi:hypothetical protein